MTKRMELNNTKNTLGMKPLGIKELIKMKSVNREYLLEPFLKQRQPIMIYSKTGLGKSWYSLSIALTIAGGGEFAGYKAPKPSKVAYFDGEMSLEDLQQRVILLVDKIGLDINVVDENFIFLPRSHQEIKESLPDLNSEDEAEYIIDFVEENDIELAVFDNYSTLVNSVDDENNASSFNNVMNLLQELSKCKCSSVLVHHANKSNGSNSYRGSSKMAVLMESIIKLDENPNAKFDEVSFKVIFEKFRQKNTTETVDRVLSLKENWEADEDMENQSNRIVEMVKSLNYSMDRDIYEKLGVSQSNFSKLKKKIIVKGLISQVEWNDCLNKAKALEDDNGFDEAIYVDESDY